MCRIDYCTSGQELWPGSSRWIQTHSETGSSPIKWWKTLNYLTTYISCSNSFCPPRVKIFSEFVAKLYIICSYLPSQVNKLHKHRTSVISRMQTDIRTMTTARLEHVAKGTPFFLNKHLKTYRDILNIYLYRNNCLSTGCRDPQNIWTFELLKCLMKLGYIIPNSM